MKMTKYSISIWGYVYNITARDEECAKRVAVMMYNIKPPDGIPVSLVKDKEHIVVMKV